MKNELETLKAMRADIDAKIEKLSKPEFEVDKWYKSTKIYHNGLILCVTSITYDGIIYGYGFEDGKYFNRDEKKYKGSGECACNDVASQSLVLATPTEVKEALEKEAVKRGFKEMVKFKCLEKWTEDSLSKFYNKEPKFLYNDRKLWITGINFYDLCIFKDGTWATPIKTMTIDDIASKLIGLDLADTKSELIRMKSELIETLNNL